MVIRGYTEDVSGCRLNEVRVGTYHVLHDINTQRAGIVGHWNSDAEANKHDYGRDAKDQHVFLAMSEKVYASAHVTVQWMKRLTEPKGSG